MIHRFRIQNFKSIADVDVNLAPVTVLVGKSGTGKSNFVQSLRFLRDALMALPTVAQSWAQVRPMTAPDGPTSFCAEFSVDSIEETFRYELSLNKGGLNQPLDMERLSLGEKILFHQAITKPGQLGWITQPDLHQVPAPGAIALGRIPSISEIVIAYTALTSGIGCYIFSDKVLCQPVQGQQQTRGLGDDAGNFLDILKDVFSNLRDLKVRKGIIATLQRVNPSISSVELDDILKPKNVVVGHRFDGKTLALGLSQESDGFRRFYAHLLAIYQQPPKETLIFEHPEDGIHPGALSLLADEFNAAPEQGQGQVILTTHSPQLLDHFDVTQIRVVELANSHTRIGLVSSEQLEAVREGLLEPGELLTVNPARLQAETVGE